MKALLVIPLIVLLASCASPQQSPEQCQQFERIYQAYLIARENGNAPSDAEITAAKAAAIYLVLNCGYTGIPSLEPTARAGIPQEPGPVDENLVPLLEEPED